MKKVLFYLLFLLSLNVSGQFAKPSGAVTISTYSFFRLPADSAIGINQGNINLNQLLLGKWDTVKVKGYATNYKLLKRVELKDSTTNVKGYKTYYSSRVQDITTNATYYPIFTSSTSGQYLANVSSSKLTFNPSTGNITATILQLSDRRLKHDIQPLTPFDYKKLTDIKIVKAVFNDDTTNTHRFCVIAQDVETSLPQFVYTDQSGQKAVYYIELMLAKIALLEKEIEILKKTKKDKWRAE